MTFDRLGRFAVRRRWWIVAAWAALILLAIPLAPRAPGALSAGGFILDDLESARAKQVLQSGLGLEPSAFVLVYTSDTLTAGTPQWLAAVSQATRDVARAPHVTRVLSHVLAPRQVSADDHTAYDIVFLDLPPDDSPDAIPSVAAALHQVPGLTVRIGGGPAVLRRRPVGDRDRPAPERAHLAPAGGARPAGRVRRRGRRSHPARGRAARPCSSRWPRSSWSRP